MNAELECERILLVQADFDGELDAAEAAALAGHIEQCQHCQAASLKLEHVRKLLRGTPRYEVPAGLSEAIRERAQLGTRPLTNTVTAASKPARWRPALGWSLAAALALVTVSLVLSPRQPDISAQLVSNHIRAMQLDSHLIDVVSSDHHTVKPWFAGKVSFSPPVKELADYVLKGGRVDVVDGQPVAVLVYQAGRHFIDVYVWPMESKPGTLRESRQLSGFNMRSWSENGLEVWCVSDMGSVELDRFAEHWRAAEPGGQR